MCPVHFLFASPSFFIPSQISFISTHFVNYLSFSSRSSPSCMPFQYFCTVIVIISTAILSSLTSITALDSQPFCIDFVKDLYLQIPSIFFKNIFAFKLKFFPFPTKRQEFSYLTSPFNIFTISIFPYPLTDSEGCSYFSSLLPLLHLFSLLTSSKVS